MRTITYLFIICILALLVVLNLSLGYFVTAFLDAVACAIWILVLFLSDQKGANGYRS